MDYDVGMAKGFAPAAERNREPILEVLRRVLPTSGVALEIASGTGQHAAFFSANLPSLRWQPTDRSPDALASIRSWVDGEDRHNLLPPLALDVSMPKWPIDSAAAVVCINMIHICPWETTEALFRGAREVLDVGAPLVTYGPYRLHGQHTAPSNAAFDENLRSRDPRWGIRDVDSLGELAERSRFVLEERVDMPANNMSLVWRRIA
jgi:hypothetical protein